ncbi:hypothetical protein P6166_13550 [Stenotrophomonas sp. HITSZ_GD]|uniref:hypothetical protein n=1 Tax=Stenotrophomonas sp. HITSZ_GD TaxID=3037248 RepID=UPI00240D78F7|nr:hypothetical protein [Stenotrophomonas sp. HITSZ_GD]MDG2526381.1 hypothetical protein [Stenotrophomonas sp. HITSZ_GD]
MTTWRRRRARAGRRARTFWILLGLALCTLSAVVIAGQPPAVQVGVAIGFAILLLFSAWRAQWARMTFSASSGVDLMALVALGADALDDSLPAEDALPDPQRFDPDDAGRRPWRDLDGAQVLRRLQQQHDAWWLAEQRRVRQQQRQRALGLALALVDHGVPLRDGDDALPDTAALRAEALLLQADPGPAVLDERPALLARRYELAIAATSGGEHEALQVQWRLLRALRPLVPGIVHLRERGWRIGRLAWNPQADLDQVDVAYALATDFRQLLRDWLLGASTVQLPDGMTLEAWLLARCPNLRREGGDDLTQVEAAQPLWPAFLQLHRAALAALDAAARERESAAAAGGAQSSW